MRLRVQIYDSQVILQSNLIQFAFSISVIQPNGFQDVLLRPLHRQVRRQQVLRNDRQFLGREEEVGHPSRALCTFLGTSVVQFEGFGIQVEAVGARTAVHGAVQSSDRRKIV